MKNRRLFLEGLESRVPPSGLGGLLPALLSDPFEQDSALMGFLVELDEGEGVGGPVYVGDIVEVNVFATDQRDSPERAGIFAAAADVLASEGLKFLDVTEEDFYVAGENELLMDGAAAHITGIDPTLMLPGESMQLVATFSVEAVEAGTQVIVTGSDGDSLTENLPYGESDPMCEWNGEVAFGGVQIEVVEPFGSHNPVDPTNVDRSGDGTNIFDALILIEHVDQNGVYEVDPSQDFLQLAPDVDNSGTVTALDVMKVVEAVEAQAEEPVYDGGDKVAHEHPHSHPHFA
jgi:hypothetical protein